MGLEVGDHREPHQTPKLTLFKLPPYCRPIRHPPPPMQTPPLRHLYASVPFRWEEAPGKPIASAGGGITPPRSSKSLDLPPRLIMPHDDDGKITGMPSPNTVLDDGPYVGRSLSLACTFSFRRGLAAGREDGPRLGKRKFGSGRWGSYVDEKKSARGNLVISHSLGEFLECEKNVEITGRRGRKRKSFFGLTAIDSNFLGGIYASFKQAVSWRRAQPINAKKECC